MKIDLDTAIWITDKVENDRSVFPIKLIECEKCNAVYMPDLGHDCKRIIDVPHHEYSEDDIIEEVSNG